MTFPGGATFDLDARFQYIFRVGEFQACLAAAEQIPEDLLEIPVDNGKALEKMRCISSVSEVMRSSSSRFAVSASCICSDRNCYRAETSSYSAIAATLTVPNPRMRLFRLCSPAVPPGDLPGLRLLLRLLTETVHTVPAAGVLRRHSRSGQRFSALPSRLISPENFSRTALVSRSPLCISRIC